jgi:hypothetical protein
MQLEQTAVFLYLVGVAGKGEEMHLFNLFFHGRNTMILSTKVEKEAGFYTQAMHAYN